MEDCAPEWFRRPSSPMPPVLTDATVVYEGTHLKAIIRREKWKRNRRFHFEDHKYVLVFEKTKPTEENVTLVSFSALDVIEKGVAGVLKALQEYYLERRQMPAASALQTKMRRRFSHQAFICVESEAVNRLRGAITIGKHRIHKLRNFSIEDESPEHTANYLATKLYRQFSKYERNITMSDKFKIHFRIVGGPLIAVKKRSKRGFTMDNYLPELRKHEFNPLFPDVVEGNTQGKTPSFVLPTPVGYKGHELVFQRQCLLTSLILARVRSRLLFNRVREKKQIPGYIRSLGDYFNNPSNGLSIPAGMYMESEIARLKIIFKDESSVDEVMSYLSAEWKLQLIVYDTDADIVGKYPEELETSWPFVFLLLTTNDNGVGHLELITNFAAFCQGKKPMGFTCFFPDCNYKSKYFCRRRHICKTSLAGISSCFNCRKMVATGMNLLIDKETKQYLFCQNKCNTEIKCHKCNLVMRSLNCFNDHRQICSALGFLCLKCNKYVHGAQSLVKKSHRCGIETCLICFQPLSTTEPMEDNAVATNDPRSEHMCSFSKVKLRKEIPNLGFVHAVSPTVGNANCIICFELEQRQTGEKDEKCCYHQQDEQSECEVLPSVCTFIYEDTVHETFSGACFIDNSIANVQPQMTLPPLPSYIPVELRKLLPNLDLSKKKNKIQFNNVAKANEAFDKAVEKLGQKLEGKALDQLLQFILQEKFRNFVILLENFEQLDLVKLGLILNNIEPKHVLEREGNTMSFKVSTFNITFGCAKCFVEQEVWQGLEEGDSLSFFPLSLLNSSSWKTIQEIPMLDSFIELQDDRRLRHLKRLYWEAQRGKKWDPVNQLIDSSSSVVIALAKMMLSYIECRLQFQVSCIDIFGKPECGDEELPFLHPLFSASTNGHVYDTFRVFEEGGKLRIIKQRDEFPTKTKASRPETEFTLFLKKLDPLWISEFGSGYQVKFSLKSEHATGAHTIHECDAYHPLQKTVISFLGCYWHGCGEEQCSILKEKNTPIMRQKHKKFEKDAQRLLDLFPDHIERIIYVQECVYREIKRNDTDLREFAKTVRSHLRHLVFRDAFRGQIQDAFILRFEAALSPGRTLYSLDCNKLYPKMAIDMEIATGRYSIVMVGDDEQHHIQIEGGCVFYRGVPFLGIALVRVLAPQDLFVPALNYKVNGDNIGILCLRCAINAAKKRNGIYKRCRHKEKSRSFTSTYSSVEIAYATSLGYKFHFYEIAIFEHSEKLLERFTLALIYEQMLVSPYPADCTSVSDMQCFLDSANNSLNFKDRLGKILTLDNVRPNTGQCKLRKSIVNSFLGYFNLNLHEATQTSYVSSYKELAKRINAGNIRNVTCFGNMVQITTERKKKQMPRGQLKTNVMVGILITSYARIYIHECAMKLIRQGAVIYRINCDALTFSYPADKPLDIKICSSVVGSYKHEYKHIKSIAQLGVNTMSVLHVNEAGDDQVSLKTGGIMQHEEISPTLTHQAFVRTIESSIEAYVAETPPSQDGTAESTGLKVHNVRSKKIGLQKIKVRNVYNIEMKSAFSRRQLVNSLYPYVTVPYGYLGNLNVQAPDCVP